MTNHSDPIKPEYPKGILLNRRVKVIAISILVLVVAFLVHSVESARHDKSSTNSHDSEALSTETSLTAIQTVKAKKTFPTLIAKTDDTHESSNSSNDKEAMNEENRSKISIEDETVKQALDAPISVYQSPAGEGKSVGATHEVEVSKSVLPPTPWTLSAGSIIPAILVTGIHSELPGTLSARVRENVYDSQTGKSLLIPQGAVLVGSFDRPVAYGGTRVLVAWTRLIFPNGASLNLTEASGSDLSGMSGLPGKVNNHTFRLFGMSLLYSVFSAAGELSHPEVAGSVMSPEQQVGYGMGDQMAQTGSQLVSKNLDIAPTIQISPGTAFTILLAHDVVLPGPYPFDVNVKR